MKLFYKLLSTGCWSLVFLILVQCLFNFKLETFWHTYLFQGSRHFYGQVKTGSQILRDYQNKSDQSRSLIHGNNDLLNGGNMSTANTVNKHPSSQPSECPNLVRPENIQESFHFQAVDRQNSTFVFSAFLDERDGVVRIIGLSLAPRANYACHLWYKATEQWTADLLIVSGTTAPNPDSHKRRYTAVYIHCKLPVSPVWPYAVTLASRACQGNVTSPGSVLKVMQPSQTLRHNFTVCVKPVNRRYSRAYELIEFIEMNRILGASKFQVYVNSAGLNVRKILDWYQTQDVVEIIDWNIPGNIRVNHWPKAPQDPEIHAFGQLASSNDCVNRNRGSSRYLVLVDWDEILVPKNHSTWMDMINALDRHQGHAAVEYNFACLFYRKDFPINKDNFPGKDLALRYQSNVLLVNKREKKPYPYLIRSKYITQPNFVHMAGIHTVHKYRQVKKNITNRINVPLSFGASYHYRDWSKPYAYSRKGVTDSHMQKFRERLLKRLHEVWKQFPDVPLDIPLQYYRNV